MADGSRAAESNVDDSAQWWQTELHGLDRRDHRRLLANSIFHSRSRPDPSALIMEIRGGTEPVESPVIWIGDAPFADLFDEDQVISCLPSGRIRFTDPTTFIAAYAARACDEIAAIHPPGPVVLGGFCFDAWIAYEVAIRLAERGWSIQRVITVEAYTLDRIEQAFNTYLNHLLRLSRGSIRRRADYLVDLLKPLVTGRFGLGRSPENAKGIDHGDTSIEQDILDLTHAAIAAYEPAPSALEVDLIFGDQSMQGRYYRIGPRFGLTGAGWHRTLVGPMTIIEAPGRHGTILDPDHIEALAAVVQARIDDARAAASLVETVGLTQAASRSGQG